MKFFITASVLPPLPPTARPPQHRSTPEPQPFIGGHGLTAVIGSVSWSPCIEPVSVRLLIQLALALPS